MNKKHKDNAKQLLKVIKTKEDEFYFGLYLLKTCYKTILTILETFCGGFFNIPDPNLNFSYLQCQKQIKIILNSQEKIYKKIGEPPQLFESLVGDIEEADQKWELGYRQAARKYYGKIENLFVQNGNKSYDLPKFIQNFFGFTKKAINYHRKTEFAYREVFEMIPGKETVLKYGNLTIDTNKSTLQYKSNPPVGISLTTNEIAFLAILIRENGDVIHYEDIVEKIQCGAPNELAYRKCHYLKRNLEKFLIKAGMNKKEVAKTIISVRNTGYRIGSD